MNLNSFQDNPHNYFIVIYCQQYLLLRIHSVIYVQLISTVE